jgi:hypothetical protein
MPLDSTIEARLSLAERILELAEHSSEGEMRGSLSGMYYAVYHVALVLVGNKAHGEIPEALDGLEAGLGKLYAELLVLRQRADYDPSFVTRQFGSVENLRLQFPLEMEKARALYERLRQMEINLR